MSKFTETYLLKHQDKYSGKATFVATTGQALDYQEITLEFSCAGSALAAPEKIEIAVSWNGEPKLN